MLVGTPAGAGDQDAALNLVTESLHPIPDLRGSAAWKRAVVSNLVATAIADAASRKETA